MKPFLRIIIALVIASLTSLQAAISINEPDTIDSLLKEVIAKEAKVDGPAAAANRAFSEGRFEEAVDLAKPLVESGDADALFLMGLAHESGRGLEFSRDKALDFYRKASSAGHEDAGYRGALLLLLSDKENERDEARKTLEKAAETQVAVAGRLLGEAWLRGRLSKEPKPEKAIEWWHRAAKADDLTSIRLLAALREGSFGFEKFIDPAKSIELYRQAAELGDVQSMIDLGSRLLNGQESLRNEQRGRAWLSKAAESGDLRACLVLGDYEQNVKKDDKAALQAYERGKDGGQLDCTLLTADFYLAGRGTEKDPQRGKALLLQAAEGGHPMAQFRVAMLLISAENPDLAAVYINLLSASNQQLAVAQNELGLFYLGGKLGVADPAAATSWLTRAAKLGNAAAQNNLAALYEVGAAGLQQDYKNAGELYGLAAQQGHVEATLALARLLSSGGPVEKNLPKAWALASLAEERGGENGSKMKEAIGSKLDAQQRKKALEILAGFKKPASKGPKVNSPE